MGAKKITFYIDGFNFYFGIRRKCRIDPQWGMAYWINVVKLCESFLAEDQELQKVIYFTSSPLSPEKNSRQSAFLNANKALSGDRFEIIRGKFLEKTVVCPNCKYAIPKPEEKRTDVNISVRMLEDCFRQQTDIIALISADSDLIPPMASIMKYFDSIAIKVYFPPANHSRDISDFLLGNKSKKPVLLEKNLKRFVNAAMPDDVGKYSIPIKWKTKRDFALAAIAKTSQDKKTDNLATS